MSLSNNEINRYSRQIILPNFGVEGQLRLKQSSVLIVGAGGLGCPCAIYLAGAGVSHIGLLDYDLVELNNLHRQILHKESSSGSKKVDSAVSALKELNSTIKMSTFHTEINSSNAMDIVKQFDVVVDASDNVATRYLLNDVCFFNRKPLVSGSALQWEGQLTVYHHKEGPCYRCLFPEPPPPAAVTNCGEGGVLGAIPGTIGVLQALQVINIILDKESLSGILLLFDGSDCSFRRIKLRGKVARCALCGDNPSITSLIDYEEFCMAKANDKNPDLKLLSSKDRVTPTEFAQARCEPHILIDVRSKQEFDICHIQNSVNVPIKSIESGKGIKLFIEEIAGDDAIRLVYVVCRRGNDSQKAVVALTEAVKGYQFKDIIGGLHGWAKHIDPDFPVY